MSAGTSRLSASRLDGAAPADALASLADGKLGVDAGGRRAAGDERQQRSRDRVIDDSEGLLATRYDARPGTFYLLRPDQHVCARWRSFDRGPSGAPSPARPAILERAGGP